MQDARSQGFGQNSGIDVLVMPSESGSNPKDIPGLKRALSARVFRLLKLVVCACETGYCFPAPLNQTKLEIQMIGHAESSGIC